MGIGVAITPMAAAAKEGHGRCPIVRRGSIGRIAGVENRRRAFRESQTGRGGKDDGKTE
jgi:hypothetical protein